MTRAEQLWDEYASPERNTPICHNCFIDGYHFAEKDLLNIDPSDASWEAYYKRGIIKGKEMAALTWEDIKEIDELLAVIQTDGEYLTDREVYQEVLKRFNTIQVPGFSINGKQGDGGVESSTELTGIPEWCGYPKHLRCMSLAKGYVNGEEYCKKCDAYKGNKK